MSNLPTNKRKGDHLTAEEWNAIAAVVNELDASSYVKPEQGIPKEDLSEGVQENLDKASASYSKPASGIPKSDLNNQVQESLDAANSAYQKPLTGIPSTDFSEEVIESLSKANSSMQTITIGDTITGEAGTDAGVDNIGTINDPILQFTIPRGLNGTNGKDAVEPFKGWYPSVNDLPVNPVVGDYAYVKGTESTDPAAIYECTIAGTWSDSGRTADTSNVQTFASGEEVNQTSIDDTHLVNPKDGALPKAKDVIDKCRDVKADIEDYKETILNPTFIDGYYILSDGSIAGNGTSNNSYAEINIVGYDYVAFEGVSIKNTDSVGAGFAFGHYTDNVWILDSAMPFINQNEQEDNYQSIEYVKHVPHNSTHVRVTVYTYLGVVSKQSFYCYGRNYVDAKIDVYENIDLELYRTTALLRTGGTYSIASSNKSYMIPVEEGSIVKFKARSVGAGGYTTHNGYLFRIDGNVESGATWSEETLPGAKFISIEAGVEYEIEVPNGCTNMYFPVNRSTSYYFIDLEYFKVEKKEVQYQKLTTIQSVEQISGGYYDITGSFIENSNIKYLSFPINGNSEDIFVSFRNGYLNYQTLALCVYLDYNKNFIGYESTLVGKGYVYVKENYHLLNIPNNASYVLLSYVAGYKTGALKQSKSDVIFGDIHYLETDITETIYGTIEGSGESEPNVIKSAWGFRLPKNYDKNGSPTPIVAMLHGASGYVTPNVLGYGNNAGTETASYWKDWQDKYLDAGFVVLDINGYGVYQQNENSGFHGGNPMAIQTLKKAFEFLKINYNVSSKLFLHGSSMGGGLAQNYVKMYPNDVISVALFAPICLASSLMLTSTDLYAVAWGYVDNEDMLLDNYSHVYNYSPLFNCLKVKKSDSTIAINKVSEEMVEDFLKDTDGIAGESEYIYIDNISVPVKMWIGTNDASVPPAVDKALYNAFKNGQTNIQLRIVDRATHDFCVGGTHTFVADEAIRFFKESLEGL